MLSKKKKLKSSMIATICILLVSAVFPGKLQADAVTEEWVARYDGPASSTDHGRLLAVDSEGNVYMTGCSMGIDTSYDYVTVKYDSSGNQLWVQRYNGSGNYVDGPYAIVVDCQGNVYVTGDSHGTVTDEDFATIKYDTDGNQLWVRRYNGPASGPDGGRGIAVDNDGNVYVTGYSRINSSGNDFVTMKYDTNGNLLWMSYYNAPANSSDSATSIAIDSEGNVYVTGLSYGEGPGGDYASVKYDSNGNQLWASRYNGPANKRDYPYGIAVDASGNVYVAGSSYNTDFTSEGNYSDYATVKYSPDGVEQWVKRYDGPANREDYVQDMAVDAFGNTHVTGWSRGLGGFDYGTVKYDTNGNQLWCARYDEAGYGVGIALDAAGSVYVTGNSSDFRTVKYDSNGNQLWDIAYNGTGNKTDFASDIVVDGSGNVYITGDSYGIGTDRDCAVVKYSQIPNQPPIADAGPDQALLELGATVTLDGSQSYDLEGDPITYSWVMIETPVGSGALLSNPASAWPSFVADAYGDYVIELVVSDPRNPSDPDTVTVSFDNIKPVADAGDNQAVIVGDTVNLDGSGSSDINGDELTYSWILEAVPAGSQAVLLDACTVAPSFVADEAGTYVVSLIVNDGLLDSDVAAVSIEVISSYDALVQILLELIDQVNLLPDESLKNKNLKNTLTNKINEVLAMVDEGLYVDAKDKLQNDILRKTNGCDEMGEPDKNDWITTCPEQGQVYPLIIQAIELLETLI